MAVAARSSNCRVVFVLIGLFALVLVKSSTQVMAAKDLADHSKAAKTTASTTQEETTTEMNGSRKDSGSPKSGYISYGALCKYGCCAPVLKPGSSYKGGLKCTRCCSSADEARIAAKTAASVLPNDP